MRYYISTLEKPVLQFNYKMKSSELCLPLLKNCNVRKGPGAWRSSYQAKIFQLFFLPLNEEKGRLRKV